jgi:hypothetical protein
MPPPGFGCQKSEPVTGARVRPTWSGTFQSKTFVRRLLSVTCFGGTLLIQWMRWWCHWKLPVRSTTCQSGVAPAFAVGGTLACPKRSSLR